MLAEKYPNIEIHYIEDTKLDEDWSHKLDAQIRRVLKPQQSALLYGSRDSFIAHYKGRYPTETLESDIIASGTEVRRRISNQLKASEDFRRGVIYAATGRYINPFPTIDVFVFNPEKTKILLLRKAGNKKLNVIGGFSSTTTTSFEEDALKKVEEETGCKCSAPTYLGSTLVDDWRYRGEDEKIKTIVFLATHTAGSPTLDNLKSDPNIEALVWVDTQTLLANPTDILEPEHAPLVAFLPKYEAPTPKEQSPEQILQEVQTLLRNLEFQIGYHNLHKLQPEEISNAFQPKLPTEVAENLASKVSSILRTSPTPLSADDIITLLRNGEA
jgi:bifunctional NMN adenylyltransferase/nudix hydrolase